MPKPVCFTYSSSQWQESHCFFKNCFYGELFHCYRLQRLMILTALELSISPSFIRPCSRNAHWIVFIFCWPQQQKPIDFLKPYVDVSLTFFSGRGGRIFLVCQSFSRSHLKLLSVPLCMCFSSRTSNEARCSWYAEKCFLGCRYPICLDFIWSRHALFVFLVNLLTFKKKCA